MNYPSPAYGAPVAVAAKDGITKTVIIIVAVIVGVVVVLGAIAIALGVGLGVGLHKDDSSLSTLSAPTVTCNVTSASISDTCGCALTTPTFSSRIFNGQTATTNSWPWMGIVNTGSRICSGFLISNMALITAANCVYNVNMTNITVYLGVSKLSDTTNRVIRAVISVLIDSAYTTSSFDKDSAILLFNESVTFGNTMAACCTDYNASLLSVGTHAVIAGWGQTSLVSGYSDSLKQAIVQVKDPSACGISSTDNTTFCAGYGAIQTCPGDNGGPLMISTGNSWACAGIIIGGSSACYSNTHYTRISAY